MKPTVSKPVISSDHREQTIRLDFGSRRAVRVRRYWQNGRWGQAWVLFSSHNLTAVLAQDFAAALALAARIARAWDNGKPLPGEGEQA